MKRQEYKINCDCFQGHFITLKKIEWDNDNGVDYSLEMLGMYMPFWGKSGRLWQALKLIFCGECFYDEIEISKDDLKKLKEECEKLLI